MSHLDVFISLQHLKEATAKKSRQNHLTYVFGNKDMLDIVKAESLQIRKKIKHGKFNEPSLTKGLFYLLQSKLKPLVKPIFFVLSNCNWHIVCRF